MIDTQITSIAYRLLFDGAESHFEDWIDEEGEFSREDYEKIFKRGFELLAQLRETYL